MTPGRLELEPLTAEAFEPFGDVIQRQDVAPELINEGRTRKYANLARVETSDGGGNTGIHLYRSTAIALPFTVERMERHPLGSQAFIPLHNRPFPVIVAPPGDGPLAGDVRGFISNGKQGVNLRKGVWHHYQISLDGEADYLVIDRIGPGGDFEEWILDPPLQIKLS